MTCEWENYIELDQGYRFKVKNTGGGFAFPRRLYDFEASRLEGVVTDAEWWNGDRARLFMQIRDCSLSVVSYALKENSVPHLLTMNKQPKEKTVEKKQDFNNIREALAHLASGEAVLVTEGDSRFVLRMDCDGDIFNEFDEPIDDLCSFEVKSLSKYVAPAKYTVELFVDRTPKYEPTRSNIGSIIFGVETLFSLKASPNYKKIKVTVEEVE